MNPHAHTLRLPRPAPARVLACGAHLKNRACLLDGDQVHWSALHGDLADAGSREGLVASVDALLAAARGPIDAVSHDLHPDFFSTDLALERAHLLGVPVRAVQHHHAHVAAVVAEHGLQGATIGIALDGMGLGTDGTAWGGELLGLGAGVGMAQCHRLAHLAPLAQPGGDMAAREPWRLAAAVLHGLGRGHEIVPVFTAQVGASAAAQLQMLLERDLQCPRSSSAGRWFDAAAGALGLCVRQTAEAEAAQALEALASAWVPGDAADPPPDGSLDLAPLVGSFVALRGRPQAEQARAAASFHVALAACLAAAARSHAAASGCQQVVLAGGCMANRLLLRLLQQFLARAGLQVSVAHSVSCGDAGLALGQAWVAAWSVSRGDGATAPVRAEALALEH